MDIIEFLDFIGFWLSSVFTLLLAFLAILFNWISSTLVNNKKANPRLVPLVIGPDFAFLGISLDITALIIAASSPQIFKLSKYFSDNTSMQWVAVYWLALILTQILIYGISLYYFHKSNYNLYEKKIVPDKSRLYTYKRISDIIGIGSFLFSLIVMTNMD